MTRLVNRRYRLISLAIRAFRPQRSAVFRWSTSGLGVIRRLSPGAYSRCALGYPLEEVLPFVWSGQSTRRSKRCAQPVVASPHWSFHEPGEPLSHAPPERMSEWSEGHQQAIHACTTGVAQPQPSRSLRCGGIKRRVNASQGFRSFEGAWRTIQGYEILHMIRKGQVRWLRKDDVLGQIQFIRQTLGLKS
jgi:DDE domain